MRLDFGLLADAATEKNGQLNILGTFDQINTTAFPSVHPICALVLRIAVHPTETGTHTFRIVLRDSDGKPVPGEGGHPVQIEGGFQVERGSAPSWIEPAVPLVVNLFGLRFTKPDTYSFSVLVDERHLGDVRFFVTQVNQAAAA